MSMLPPLFITNNAGLMTLSPHNTVTATIWCPQLRELRVRLGEVVSQEGYMGERMPLRWLALQQDLACLAHQGSHYATYDQVRHPHWWRKLS